MNKIVHIKPTIGTKEEWDEHYQIFVQNEKKLSKLSSDMATIDSELYGAYNQLYAKGDKRRFSLKS